MDKGEIRYSCQKVEYDGDGDKAGYLEGGKHRREGWREGLI